MLDGTYLFFKWTNEGGRGGKGAESSIYDVVKWENQISEYQSN